LKCLFMPTEIGAQYDETVTAAEESYPLGPVLFGAEVVTGAIDGFGDGIAAGGDCADPEGDMGTIAIPSDEVPGGSIGLDVIPLCPVGGPLESFAGVVRNGVALLVIVGTGIALYRIASSAMGGGATTGGDDE